MSDGFSEAAHPTNFYAPFPPNEKDHVDDYDYESDSDLDAESDIDATEYRHSDAAFEEMEYFEERLVGAVATPNVAESAIATEEISERAGSIVYPTNSSNSYFIFMQSVEIEHESHRRNSKGTCYLNTTDL